MKREERSFWYWYLGIVVKLFFGAGKILLNLPSAVKKYRKHLMDAAWMICISGAMIFGVFSIVFWITPYDEWLCILARQFAVISILLLTTSSYIIWYENVKRPLP